MRSTSVGVAPALSDWELVPVEDAVSPGRSRDVRAADMSADGRYLAVSWEGRWSQISVYDRDTDTAELVTVTPGETRATGGDSYPVAMTPDGRYLLFSSEARDLLRRDTNREQDVFLRDLRADRTRRISVGWEGQQDNSEFGAYAVGISDNGRAAFFTSWGTRFAPGFTTSRSRVYARYLDKPTTVMVSQNGPGDPAPSSVGIDVSDDGRFLLFDSSADKLPHPSGADTHVYRRNLWSGRTVLVSQRNDGLGFRLELGGTSLLGNGRAASFRASFVDRYRRASPSPMSATSQRELPTAGSPTPRASGGVVRAICPSQVGRPGCSTPARISQARKAWTPAATLTPTSVCRTVRSFASVGSSVRACLVDCTCSGPCRVTGKWSCSAPRRLSSTPTPMPILTSTFATCRGDAHPRAGCRPLTMHALGRRDPSRDRRPVRDLTAAPNVLLSSPNGSGAGPHRLWPLWPVRDRCIVEGSGRWSDAGSSGRPAGRGEQQGRGAAS